jgi:drug/metabolite transporter (DMT)-like permease
MTGANSRGVWLSLVTVTSWSLLPITLKIASRHLDPYTLTWYRFATSAVVLGAFLAVRGQLPPLAVTRLPRTILLLVGACVGLASNYVLYVVSLSYVSPTVSTVITQLGPLLLMLGGVWLFHEHLNSKQTIGVVCLVAGLFLFFNRRLVELSDFSGRAGVGTVILLLASVTWAMYGLSQKVLLRRFSAAQILLLIYVGATALLLVIAHPLAVRGLSALELVMLALCAANTLVAYGALAEALHFTDASVVGAVLAVGPVASLLVTWATNRVSPGFFEPDLLNVATVLGAAVVTLGSGLTASR